MHDYTFSAYTHLRDAFACRIWDTSRLAEVLAPSYVESLCGTACAKRAVLATRAFIAKAVDYPSAIWRTRSLRISSWTYSF
eukprot:330178-Pleurochrysis_carterae.AAC.4